MYSAQLLAQLAPCTVDNC